MVDLHMHTVYSDGLLQEKDVIGRASAADLISITDHNSVYSYLSLSSQNYIKEFTPQKYLVGVELTIEGYPDFLLYYPDIQANDIQRLNGLETVLQNIRQSEEKAIKKAYEILIETDLGVFYSDWDSDYHSYYAPNGHRIEARTRDLAIIRYNVRTSENQVFHFDKDDLIRAREARREANRFVSIPYNPYEVQSKTQGKIVLAHPIKTAYIQAGREKSKVSDIVELMSTLIHTFNYNGGRTIEWEYIDNDSERYPLLYDNKDSFRQCVIDEIKKLDLTCTWGTDSHICFPEDSVKWSEWVREIFCERTPKWIKSRLH